MSSRWIALSAASLLVGLAVVPAGASGAEPGDRVAELRHDFIEATSPAGHFDADGTHRPSPSRNVSEVGSNDLGGGGFNSDVWALDKHAYVGTWGLFTEEGLFCPNDGTKVIDISDPTDPEMVNTLPTEPGTQTNDVKLASVNSPHFRGDLLAVSNEDCAAPGARGFELWDVSNPADASPLGRYGPPQAFDVPSDLVEWGFGVHNVFIFEQGRRDYVAAVVDFGEAFQLIFGAPLKGDLRIVDVTDPTAPVEVADWGIAKDLGLDPFAGQGDDFSFSFLHDVWVENGIAYLSYWDAGLILLDVSDPTDPQFISRTPYAPTEEGNTHVAVPARGGTLVITGDEDFTPGPWGFMRVFDTSDITAPVEIGTFATENALNAPPPGGDFSAHNVVVRGNTAYFSWYSDGIRLVDISQPTVPREIGSFVPEPAADPFGILPTAPEVWGVYVQNQLILASDMNSGLHILRAVP